MSQGQLATYTEPGQIEGQLAAATQLWAAGPWRQLLASYQRAAGAASCVCVCMGGGWVLAASSAKKYLVSPPVPEITNNVSWTPDYQIGYKTTKLYPAA
jgi:hypothetical protein